MRILFLQDDFPPESLGGAGTVAFNLAQEFRKKGHQVYVICAVKDKDKAGQRIEEGLAVFRLYANYHERWRAYLGLYNPQIINQIKKLFSQIRPDIAHFHNVHYYLSYASLKIAKKYSRAVFLTAHDVMSFHYGKLIEFINPNNLSIPKTFNYRITPLKQIKRFKKRYNPLRNIIIRHYLKKANKIFPVSSALKEALKQNGIENTEVIYNGINADEWQIDDKLIDDFKKKYRLFNKKVIFMIGRLSDLKGGEKIIRAMEIVNQKIPEAVLMAAGDKQGYAQKMLSLAENKNIQLLLTGYLRRDELKAATRSSDLAVVPSICFDSFPTSNLEAMACQKPVIGTCFGGTPEIVLDNITGYIVNPFNIEKMAEKIIALLSDSQKAEQFGQAGYERVKRYFSLQEQAEKILKYYEQF